MTHLTVGSKCVRCQISAPYQSVICSGVLTHDERVALADVALPAVVQHTYSRRWSGVLIGDRDTTPQPNDGYEEFGNSYRRTETMGDE